MTQTNDQVRQQATDVLQGNEFQSYLKTQQTWDPLGWILDKLNWLFQPRDRMRHTSDDLNRWNWAGFDPEVIRIIIYVALGILVLVLIYFLVTWLRSRRREAPEAGITEAHRAEAQATYASMAADAASRHDYRQAIHYLFLATVSQVIRDADFHASDAMTNREIAAVSDFSRFAHAAPGLKNVFHAMVYQDEPFWFGGHDASAGDYTAFEENYRRFAQQVGGAHA